MNDLKEVEVEYVYLTIPAEYICVYHKILVMLSDFGEEMLKDCKANCTDRNTRVIECFNMFNSAIAARTLGKTKLAETLIKYIKAEINLLYKGSDNSPKSIIFPIDEQGNLKAFVTCGDDIKFEVDEDTFDLYQKQIDRNKDGQFNVDSNIDENCNLIITKN